MSLVFRDRQILEHIVDYCEQILSTIHRFGDQYDIYASDFIYRNATALCILQIGELVGNLTDSFKTTHTEIPWRQIKAVRNIIAQIDAEVTWEIITTDIPKLNAYCQQLLGDSNDEFVTP